MSDPYPTREEVLAGWYHFWSQNEVRFFMKDEFGNYIRDKDGGLIAVRSQIPRVKLRKNGSKKTTDT